jgi:hypothetical protein
MRTRDPRAVAELANQLGVTPDDIRSRPATFLEDRIALRYTLADLVSAMLAPFRRERRQE